MYYSNYTQTTFLKPIFKIYGSLQLICNIVTGKKTCFYLQFFAKLQERAYTYSQLQFPELK